MKWSDNAWEAARPIYERILEMPFIKELMDGSLAIEKFQYYITQDAHYLEHYGKTLSVIAAKLPSVQDSLAFIRFAEGAVVVENALHESYFKDFKITDKGIIEPSSHHYIHYLRSAATLESVEVAVAAVLPCFWIYKAVGDYIYKNQSSTNNPYQTWINTYAGEDFGVLVERAITIADRLAQQSTPTQQALMTDAFLTGSRLEFMFWDSAYHLQRW